MITRSNVGKDLSDVASGDHVDVATCWSCGTVSSANLEKNQFQFDWFDEHSSLSAPTGCSRKRRHSRVGPRLPPSSATPHAPQPCPKDKLVPYVALWQIAASPSPFLYDSINSRIPQHALSAIRAYAVGIMASPSCPPSGVLPWLCTACCVDDPARRSWCGDRGAKGSISGCLARQRGAGNEAREIKASPSWHVLNHGVLLHRCAPVPCPAFEHSKTALRPTSTYVKFIRNIPLHTVTRTYDPLRHFQAKSSSHVASNERRKF